MWILFVAPLVFALILIGIIIFTGRKEKSKTKKIIDPFVSPKMRELGLNLKPMKPIPASELPKDLPRIPNVDMLLPKKKKSKKKSKKSVSKKKSKK